MYGSVARLRLKPGAEARMQELSKEFEEARVPGYVSELVFKLDSGSDEYMLAIVFESKEAYLANANDPAQQARYAQYAELMAAAPEWNDGEVVYQHSA